MYYTLTNLQLRLKIFVGEYLFYPDICLSDKSRKAWKGMVEIMNDTEKTGREKTYLGIEFGSTRIKASLIDENGVQLADGSHDWENSLENGYWTYSQEDIINGLKKCYASLAENVRKKFGTALTSVGAIGISAMMHGFLAFDKNGKLLTPFRTWRCTNTAQAAKELTELFHFNVPQRWSISHLYQAILDKEIFIPEIACITTLAGYIHYLLTGRQELGAGDASGMFPLENNQYNPLFISLADKLFEGSGLSHSLIELMPEIRSAGCKGAFLTESGAALLDETGMLKSGIPLCPPEGDAGTGMVATNSVRAGNGNISAGTSIFAMLVLDKQMKNYYPEIDVVATPDGFPTAMVHCNNCCGELDEWVKMFGEFASSAGIKISKSELYEMLYRKALEANADCGGITAYNFISGEPVAKVENGKPMYFRGSCDELTIGKFFRAELYSAFAALKMGMDILLDKENFKAEKFTCHGGLFKVKGVAQQIAADGLGTKTAVNKNAGEGGAWGMAVLAMFMEKANGMALPDFLDKNVFANSDETVLTPDKIGTEGFEKFMTSYTQGLAAFKI